MLSIRLLVVLLIVDTLFINPSQGQVITSESDSVGVTTTPADTLSRGLFGTLKSWDKPARAALYSTILPGAGQFYNKSYWKIPVIYAGGVAIGYFLIDNHKKYLLFRSSLEVARDTLSSTTATFEDRYPDKPRLIRFLSLNAEKFRRYRDYNIVFAFLFYGLIVSEAYVDAHLKGFDISDELSLRIEPTIIPGPTFSYAPGLAFRFNFRK